MIRQKRAIRQIIFLVTGFWLLVTLVGCQTLARKFIRKPKGEPKEEEAVIQPETYPDITLSKDELYKDYFTFWEGWVDELKESLNEKANFKKQRECAYGALDNLMKMYSLLNAEKAKSLEPLINEFTAIKDIVLAGRLTSPDYYYLKNKLERIKSRVRKNFIYSKIK